MYMKLNSANLIFILLTLFIFPLSFSTSDNCFEPSAVGEIGLGGICKGMLIVDETMLRKASTGILGGDESFEILGPDQRYYSFGDSEFNIFTGQVTDMSRLFEGSQFRDRFTFNEDIGYWDVSNVVTMRNMFNRAVDFNQDISNWDVRNVTNMEGMFWNARSFNQDISKWNVSNVIDMRFMFWDAVSFDQNLNCWDVSLISQNPDRFSLNSPLNRGGSRPLWGSSGICENQTLIHFDEEEPSIYLNTSNCFNPNAVGSIGNFGVCEGMLIANESMLRQAATSIYGGDESFEIRGPNNILYTFEDSEFNIFTGQVTNMSNLFRGSFFEDNSIFNGDIGYWDVRNVTEMDGMFRDVNSFNQDLSCWNVTLIETKPTSFSTNSPLVPQNMPLWGTDGSYNCTTTKDSTDIQREYEPSNTSSEFESIKPEFSLSKLISRFVESIVNFFNILN